MISDIATPASRRVILAGGVGVAAAAAATPSSVSAMPKRPANAAATISSASRGSFVTTKDGVQIFYKDWGSGQPVVFSHGLLWNSALFAPQIAVLKDRYRCVAYDHRGQGRSRVLALTIILELMVLLYEPCALKGARTVCAVRRTEGCLSQTGRTREKFSGHQSTSKRKPRGTGADWGSTDSPKAL